MGGRADAEDRARAAPRPSSVGALGWTAAARCDRPRARQPSDDRLRGRADRQPRLQDEQRDPGTHARLGRRLRPDDRDGDPRSARRDDRGPDPLPGGRPDRPRPRRVDRKRGHRRERGAGTMMAVALKGLLGRKLRTLLTALAIILGVAMISGTYVLTDSITAAFTNIVDDSFTNADAVISGKVAFKNDDSNTGEGVVPAFPASVLTKVKQLPDVAAASGEVGDEAKLLGHDGKVISTGGGGSMGSSIDPANDARFTPLKLVSGQWPVGGGQIAIDKHTADTKHFGVGDTIGVAANQGTRRFEITGIAKYADSASIGAATIAIFDVPTAQRLFSKVG